jgi:hypothetical protein
MNRRDTVLALLALGASPLGSFAQQSGKVWRIGMLETISMALNAANLSAFLKGMQELGYVEGRDFVIDYRSAERAARSLGVQVQLFDVRRAEDLERAFEAAVKQRANALVVGQDGLTQANGKHIVELALKHRLPAIYSSGEYVDDGGLISYGVSYADLYRRAASYVDKILKGTKPGDLPIEQPTKLDLRINRKGGQGARHHDPASSARPRRSGDRMKCCNLRTMWQSVNDCSLPRSALQSQVASRLAAWVSHSQCLLSRLIATSLNSCMVWSVQYS